MKAQPVRFWKRESDVRDGAVRSQVLLERAETGWERIEVDHLVKISALFELQEHVRSMWSCPTRPLGGCG